MYSVAFTVTINSLAIRQRFFVGRQEPANKHAQKATHNGKKIPYPYPKRLWLVGFL